MAEPLYRMAGKDDNGDPIYGPWEDKHNAEKRVADVKSSAPQVDVEVESR